MKHENSMTDTSRGAEKFQAKYGPYALICGASEGLGAAYAEALAKRGLHLALIARRKNILEGLAQELKGKYPVDVISFPMDLADYQEVKQRVG
ncbi:MAG: SDR family NAD(P)-dependent oxidoreductase, partial [Treponema sp.]|nr:SDR family NAD(P)-dependent oxidoreductase [Treponema sp.]